jgi:hypothetical protein
MPYSSDCGDTDDVSYIDGMTAFLSDIDRRDEEQRLLRQMLDRVGQKQVSLSHATAFTAPWLVDASFTQEQVNWKEAYELIPLNRLTKYANYICFYPMMPTTSFRTLSVKSNDR